MIDFSTLTKQNKNVDLHCAECGCLCESIDDMMYDPYDKKRTCKECAAKFREENDQVRFEASRKLFKEIIKEARGE